VQQILQVIMWAMLCYLGECGDSFCRLRDPRCKQEISDVSEES